MSVLLSFQVNEIGKWYKPWFYSHAEKFLNKKSGTENPVEYIPLRDYYHRHTRGLFWETKYFVAFGNNVIFRYLFGWVLPLRIDIIKLITPSWVIGLLDSNHVTQDFIVPMDKLKEAIILSHQIMEVCLVEYIILVQGVPELTVIRYTIKNRSNMYLRLVSYKM